jgi:hypothetical protein
MHRPHTSRPDVSVEIDKTRGAMPCCIVIMASNAAFRMLVIMLVVIGIAIFARCFNQDPLEELLRNLTAPVCSLIPQYSNIKSL